MLSKNQMNTTFMEIAPHFLSFLEDEKGKIEKEVARLKATEAHPNDVILDDPESAPASSTSSVQVVASDSGEPTQATDEDSAETSIIKPRRVSGNQRRAT
jgi:hypothetical protein